MIKGSKILLLKLLIIWLFSLTACTTYRTDLNEMEALKLEKMSDIKKGRTCSNNFFGGFELPWIGDTAVRISGDESVITAMKNADIVRVYAVDNSSVHYILFSKRCTIVYGK